MATETFTVVDGPLEGQQYALDLSDGEDVSLRISDGTTVVYRVLVPFYDDGLRQLKYIGVDPLA
jgi:hypothetical protein